jgi:predicted hydrocarbon binding protein
MVAQVPPSGYYYPNKIGRIYIDTLEQILGAQAMPDFLRDCGLERYHDARPPENLNRNFDFADFSMLAAGLEQAQAEGRVKAGTTTQAGRLCYAQGLKAFGSVTFNHFIVGFQMLPLKLKVKLGLLAMTTIFTTLSDQRTEVVEHEDHYDYIIHTCPMCWGRHADKPICDGAVGLLEEGLYRVTELRFTVTETQCHARGDETCTLCIDKTSLT